MATPPPPITYNPAVGTGDPTAEDWATINQIVGFNLLSQYRSEYSRDFSSKAQDPYADMLGTWAQEYPSPGVWLSKHLQAYAPQILARSLDQAQYESTGAHLDPGTLSRVTQVMATNPGLQRDFASAAGAYIGTGNFTLAGFLKIAQNYGPIGQALGLNLATQLGVTLPGLGGTTSPLYLAQRQAQTQAAERYMAVTGMPPSPGLLTQLAGMDEASLSNYLDALPYHGTTYGTYGTVQKSLVSAGWQTWFGHDPSDADVKWAIGKSPEDIQARIDDSNYNPIPGMKIGEYKAYSKAGDDLSQRLFGYSTPDHLISLMHQAGIKP